VRARRARTHTAPGTEARAGRARVLGAPRPRRLRCL